MKKKIYLDDCCFNRPFDDQSHIKVKLESEAKLYIQQSIKEQKYSFVWSYILDYENSENPFEHRKIAISLWESLACDFIDESKDILEKAHDFQKSNIKSKDSLHLACAASSDCDYFITTDYQILNKLKTVGKMRIVNPIEFIVVENEEYEDK